MPVPLTKSFLTCALAAAWVLSATPAGAFCSKPIEPYCVEDHSLNDGYVTEDRCRRAVQDHVEDLTRYRNCLTAEVKQIDAAVERFRKLLGDGGAEKSRSLPASPVVPGVGATAAAG